MSFWGGTGENMKKGRIIFVTYLCVVSIMLSFYIGAIDEAQASTVVVQKSSVTKKKNKSRQLAEYTEEERYNLLFGTDVTYWTTDNKPAGYETKEKALKNLVTIKVPCYMLDKNGHKYTSLLSLTVHKALSAEVSAIFNEIYELPEKFPIHTLVGFRWNTNGEVSGPFLSKVTCMSAHAYGAAIDINMYENDYYVGAGNDLRDVKNPYYITETVREVFARHGWYWGGDFDICSDTMHFQYTGLGMLSYNTGSPFVKYSPTTPPPSSVLIKNLQRRLNRLGYYSGSINGSFDKKTSKAVKKFEKEHGLKATGKCYEELYELVWNLTHEMSDVNK